jgi:hypothetical protein
MKVARAYQISHSEFLSWSRDDRDKAVWWEIRQGETCGNCGTRPAEWDPEQGGDRVAYLAKLTTCRGCQQIEARRAAIPEGHNALGQHIVLVRPTPEPEEEVTADGPA